MKNIKDDTYYLNKMLTYINYINEYMKYIKEINGKLLPKNQDSDGVIYKFIQLKEESSKLSEQLLISNPILSKNIKLLNGFRNRLTHDYDNVSYDYFEEIINYDLIILSNEILRILSK